MRALLEQNGAFDARGNYYLLGRKVRRAMIQPQQITLVADISLSGRNWGLIQCTPAGSIRGPWTCVWETRDIEVISRHYRYWSLDMTKKYLRGLGLMTEYHQAHNLPEL